MNTELQTELQAIKNKLEIIESKLDRYIWKNDFTEGLEKIHFRLKEIDEKLKPDKPRTKK
jgi:hypothetical protein